MGIPFSIFSKLGGTAADSTITDQIYERFFRSKQIKNYDEFHTAFIDLCKFINDVMHGKHFEVPTSEQIKLFHAGWIKLNDAQRKESLATFVQEEVKILKTDDTAIIIAGLIVPAAATVAKNSSENIPQVKKIKLHLVPNYVFVPAFTFLALGCTHLLKF